MCHGVLPRRPPPASRRTASYKRESSFVITASDLDLSDDTDGSIEFDAEVCVCVYVCMCVCVCFGQRWCLHVSCTVM